MRRGGRTRCRRRWLRRPDLPGVSAACVVGALAARRECPALGAIIVAHPDDETIAAGASLGLLPGLLLVHVTDGAPTGLGDAAREGFATPAEYGAAREGELQAALTVAGVSPERVRLGVTDQEASRDMAGLAGALERLFVERGTQWVLTHAYEGGIRITMRRRLRCSVRRGGWGCRWWSSPGIMRGRMGRWWCSASCLGGRGLRWCSMRWRPGGSGRCWTAS